ncbi:MAG: 2-polyprenyl-3-methyl-6-methoxy-1,4-benzoquinone monooxygenase [Burkholderiales bacterium]|nr:2-polyprenyl-3-methyl-6-methoxy-1,4-benzoquinone monooxygenase [Burkholderiales bacterium]
MIPDRLILSFDRALRTVFGPARSARPMPGENVPEADLDPAAKAKVAALMRVNHVGEVCAQALYQGQALTARNPRAKAALAQAAGEEVDHLAWTERRIAELGGRRSLLNPLWYAGSYAIGMVAGLAGDRWNLGFLAETERQVVAHLDRHLGELSHHDAKSRALIIAMKRDEAKHATSALHLGASELPLGCRLLMRAASRVMTTTAYWV